MRHGCEIEDIGVVCRMRILQDQVDQIRRPFKKSNVNNHLANPEIG